MFHTIWTNWSPFGDKTPIGWTITFAYFATTALCYWAYRSIRLANALPDQRLRTSFWYWTTILMLVLGVNKQLDLQRLVTRFGRVLALVTHVWGHRRPMQVAFIGVIALIGLSVVIMLAVKLRRLPKSYILALFGIGFLLVFITARAASFHHADVVLGMKFHNVYVNTILELGGILWIAAAALLVATSHRNAKPG